jgi:hypothetical protein
MVLSLVAWQRKVGAAVTVPPGERPYRGLSGEPYMAGADVVLAPGLVRRVTVPVRARRLDMIRHRHAHADARSARSRWPVLGVLAPSPGPVGGPRPGPWPALAQ